MARRDATLKPRVIREFLAKYDSKRVPSPQIALNVLEQEMHVPRDAAQRALDMIIKNAEDVGFLIDNRGSKYVDLRGTSPVPQGEDGRTDAILEAADASSPEDDAEQVLPPRTGNGEVPGPDRLAHNRRVFVTHGKDRKIVEQLKELLTFGKFEPVVSVEQEAVAVPVPDKVMNDMRSCGAGIVHVGAELTLMDNEGKQQKVLNPNVLIEIGAALALYHRNFILLVEKGAELPSNLQGLYQVRYEGDRLDYDATMKLLRAFNEFTASDNGAND